MSDISRRDLLRIGALGIAGIVTGCVNTPQVSKLPDGFSVAPLAQPVIPQTKSLPKPVQGALVRPVAAFSGSSFLIYPRNSWTNAGPVMSRISSIERVKLMTFHHSGDQNGRRDVPFLAESFDDTAEHLELVRRYHVNERKWGDIGYHFAIDRAGRVWQLRNLLYTGAHVDGRNEFNLGVVVLGNFNVQQPTEAQKKQMIAFGNLARTRCTVSPRNVFTHQELGKTDCPGDTMQPFFAQARKRGLV